MFSTPTRSIGSFRPRAKLGKFTDAEKKLLMKNDGCFKCKKVNVADLEQHLWAKMKKDAESTIESIDMVKAF
jgi:hypothetical protein